MSNTITSANMNLPIPVVGVDPGADYALNIDSCLGLIDSHNHSNGQGVQINPNGLNINSDLAFNNNNLTLARSNRFYPQSAALALGTDLGCVYVAGVDLYYNDVNGNQIRITSGGAVTGATGTITGLPSGTASASYSAGTFTFQSATSTAANIDGQSIVLRNSGASSAGLTLSAPTLAFNFALTLPQVPAQTNVMTLDNSGNMASITYNAVLNASSANIAISSSSGVFSSSSTSFVPVTNLTATLTTTGHPVELSLVGDGSGLAYFQISSASSSATGQLDFFEASTSISHQEYTVAYSGVTAVITAIPVSSFKHIYQPSAGTYTWTVKILAGSGTGLLIPFTKLVAQELRC